MCLQLSSIIERLEVLVDVGDCSGGRARTPDRRRAGAAIAGGVAGLSHSRAIAPEAAFANFTVDVDREYVFAIATSMSRADLFEYVGSPGAVTASIIGDVVSHTTSLRAI